MDVAAPAATPKPDWIDQPAQLVDGRYRLAVKSGLFVTRLECEKALEPKLVAAANEYLDDLLGAGAAERIRITPEFVRALRKADYSETVASATVGPMQQVHALLEFDDPVRAELTQRWHRAMVTGRVGRTALGSAVVLGLLAAVYGYLKLDLLTAGRYRRPLRLAAVATILLVATSVAAVQRWLQF